MSEVWTCVDRLSIHHDINPLQLTAFSQLGSGGGSDELRAKGTKSAPTPVCPTVGGDLRIVASPTERIERFKPVSLVSDEFIRDSLAVAHRTSYRRREEFDVRRRAALNRRKRLSDSLPGICRLIDVDAVAVARQASTHGIAHGRRLGNDRPAPHRELRARI